MARASAGGFFTRALYLQSPFGVATNALGPITIRMASITDGTSNTHFVSEILQGAPDDIRGTIWADNPGAATYMTRFTPNGYRDYVPLFQPWASGHPPVRLNLNNADNLPLFNGSTSQGTSPADAVFLVRQSAGPGPRVQQPGK